MSERLDNINQIYGRLSKARDELTEVVNRLHKNGAGDEIGESAAELSLALHGGIDACERSVTALAAMLSVVAVKLDMDWMIDGPGIDPDQLVE